MIEMKTVPAGHTAGRRSRRSPLDSCAEGHDGLTIRSPSATTSYQRYGQSVFIPGAICKTPQPERSPAKQDLLCVLRVPLCALCVKSGMKHIPRERPTKSYVRFPTPATFNSCAAQSSSHARGNAVRRSGIRAVLPPALPAPGPHPHPPDR